MLTQHYLEEGKKTTKTLNQDNLYVPAEIQIGYILITNLKYFQYPSFL